MKESSEYTKGLVSVIIPTYNRADIIEPSIRSVQEQTYENLEIIIADDQSTDNTKELVDRLAKDDPRIKYVLNTGIKGASGARNTGIDASFGEYVTFQDSDVIYNRDKIERQLSTLQCNPDCTFCYCRFRKDLPNGHSFIFPSEDQKADDLSGDIYRLLLYDNTVDTPSIMVRHKNLDVAGHFDTDLPASEDYDLALRLARNGKAAFVDDVLYTSPTTPWSLSLDVRRVLSSHCHIVLKYKNDLIRTRTLSHRLERILTDAQKNGLLDEIAPLLEKIMQIPT